MYDQNDLTKVGKHDFDREAATSRWRHEGQESFSINIFPWGTYSGGKKLKQLKGVVRVHGHPDNADEVIKMAESIVIQLDAGEWDGRKNVSVN